MFQFTIRKVLLLTLYVAVCLSLANTFGIEGVLTIQTNLIHVVLVCVLPIAAIEYRGYRRRFAVAALVVEILFLYNSTNDWGRDDFYLPSLFAFLGAYCGGVLCAAAYRAIVEPLEIGSSWRPIDVTGRLLSTFLVPRDKTDLDDPE